MKKIALIAAGVGLLLATGLMGTARGEVIDIAQYQLNSGRAKLAAMGEGVLPRVEGRKYYAQVAGPILKKQLEYISAIKAKTPAEQAGYDLLRTQYLGLLALYDADTVQQINKLAASTDATERHIGVMARGLYDFWNEPTPELQKRAVAALEAEALKDPRSDGNAYLLIMLSQLGPTTLDIAQDLDTFVETKLTSPQAIKFRHQSVKVGRPLRIRGQTVGGRPFDSGQFKGKVVLVDFWATWCPPCMHEMPSTIATYEKFHKEGLEMVGVSCDSQRPALEKYLKEHRDVSWTQLFGPVPPSGWHRFAVEAEVKGIPTMFVIDQNGILVSRTARFDRDTIIAQLLAEPVSKAHEVDGR